MLDAYDVALPVLAGLRAEVDDFGADAKVQTLGNRLERTTLCADFHLFVFPL